MKIKASLALSNLMQKIKSNSSKWVNENGLCDRRFSWQNGYGGFSVGPSQINAAKRYIENQPLHHKSTEFKTEFVEALKIHGIGYDEAYLWD